MLFKRVFFFFYYYFWNFCESIHQAFYLEVANIRHPDRVPNTRSLPIDLSPVFLMTRQQLKNNFISFLFYFSTNIILVSIGQPDCGLFLNPDNKSSSPDDKSSSPDDNHPQWNVACKINFYKHFGWNYRFAAIQFGPNLKIL